MKSIPVGRLRHRIEVQSRTIAQDGYGDARPTWGTVAVVWAGVKPLSGGEAWQAAVAQSDLTHEVIIRHFEGLTPRMRFRFKGRVFNIETVANLQELDRYDVCRCREEV